MAKGTTAVYERLGQEIEEARLDNGLRVVLLKKPGFQKKYITFSTHYGGMDSAFIRPGETEFTRVPDGIAHFLEHKLFDQPDGTDVLGLLSRMGASPNAYTGQHLTVYLCSLVDHFDEGLDLLLDYVQTPYFTDASVAKEQGIIEQEIQTGLDSPQRMVYYSLIEALYHEHPARIRVIGSVESIRRITKELLYACHDTFYHPSNMMVVVAGDVEMERVLERVEKDMAKRNYAPREPIRRWIPDEPEGVAQEEVRHRMRLSRPYALIAFKGRLDRRERESEADYQRRLIAAELAIEAVLGRSTQTYWDLYEDGVIAARYGYSLSVYPGVAHFYAGAETEDADALRDRLTEALTVARDRGIDPERFDEARRREIGRLLSVMDDPDSLVGMYVSHRFQGLDLLRRRELLDQASLDDAAEFLRAFVQEGRRVFSVAEPQ